ncbi:MAG: hypothetical protein H8E18_00505, partial [FCB group bacterium]|nr:hypothetical protein [FCB group bacterium]
MMTRIRHSILFCASLLFGMQSLAIGQNQFNPVTPTGLPYHIIINSNSITGVYNASQVEIGIFDGALCVGSGTGTINSGQTIDIVAWEGDPTYSLEGFTSGNPISIQLAVNEYGTNNIISADVSYSIGDGSFGYGSYSVAGVTGSIEAVP